MSLSSTSVESIIRVSANVVVSAKHYSVDTLETFAQIAKAGGKQLTIKDGASISTTGLENIARAGQGNVTIDLT